MCIFSNYEEKIDSFILFTYACLFSYDEPMNNLTAHNTPDLHKEH